MKIETSVIPTLRKIFSVTYANFPTSGLSEGDLAFAIDRKCLYRWSGAAWEAIGISSRHGNIADIGNPADYPESSLYQADDEDMCYMLITGSWVFISGTSFDTTAITSGVFILDRIPLMSLDKMPRGTVDYVLRGKGAGVNPAYEALSLVEDTKGVIGYAGGSSILRELANLKYDIPTGQNYTIATDTRSYSNSRVTIGFASGLCSDDANTIKLQLIVGGVQKGETAYIPVRTNNSANPLTLLIQEALNGSVTILVRAHSYRETFDEALLSPGFGLIIGAVKMT